MVDQDENPASERYPQFHASDVEQGTAPGAESINAQTVPRAPGRTSRSATSEKVVARSFGRSARLVGADFDGPAEVGSNTAGACGSPYFHATLAGWMRWGAAMDRSPPEDSTARSVPRGAQRPGPSPPRPPSSLMGPGGPFRVRVCWNRKRLEAIEPS